MNLDITAALTLLADQPIRIIFGPKTLSQLGGLVRQIGANRALLVTDPGIKAAGHADRAIDSLNAAGVHVVVFDGACENPTTEHVDKGLIVAREASVDLIVGIGGGSAMDCAKGINLLLTNGGKMADYWGINKATNPLLPFVAVPTTAGTGSEAQSFALISDAATHRKMACGDRRLPQDGGLRPRLAILDPDLIASAPRHVAAAAGIDAIAHAVETAGSNVRTPTSQALSKAAWDLLAMSFPKSMLGNSDADTRANMLLGAHLAGAAIEQSMLGAAHASANPLTARFGIRHGQAVGLMLPHVIRFNTTDGSNPYIDLSSDPASLARQTTTFLTVAKLPTRLVEHNLPRTALPELAALAAAEWTGRFNPRPVAQSEFLEIYEAAFQ